MARRRFFVPQVRHGIAELTGDDAEHLVRVLRAEVGQTYEISDNEDVYLATITVARKSIVAFEVAGKLPTRLQQGRLILVAALFKFDRFEWLVEKATELGVDQIIPFEAVRTERGLMQAAVKRHARWQRIALEASQQARRDRLPVMSAAVGFEFAVTTAASTRILLDEDTAALPIWQAMQQANVDADVVLLLGPEGGWTEAERAHSIAAGWLPCSLGPTILRAETAGIAALSIARARFV